MSLDKKKLAKVYLANLVVVVVVEIAVNEISH